MCSVSDTTSDPSDMVVGKIDTGPVSQGLRAQLGPSAYTAAV